MFGGVVCAAAMMRLTNVYVFVLLDQTIARCSIVTILHLSGGSRCV